MITGGVPDNPKEDVMSQNLKVVSGENVLISPKSERFASLFKKVPLNDIDEVKKLLGVSLKAAPARPIVVTPRRMPLLHVDPVTREAHLPSLRANTVKVTELTSKDKKVVARARPCIPCRARICLW